MKKKDDTPRSGADSLRWIGGLLLLFGGLYLTASVLCYYFTWADDQALVRASTVPLDPRPSEQIVANPCGYGGAWMADRFVGLSFGLFGVLIPVLLLFIGLRVLRQRPVLWNRSVLILVLVLLLGSLTMGFLLDDHFAVFGSGWGGAFGIEISRFLGARLGWVGQLLLLMAAWIVTGVLINRNFINRMNRVGNAMLDQGEALAQRVKKTVEAAEPVEPEPVEQPVAVEPVSPLVETPSLIEEEESPFFEEVPATPDFAIERPALAPGAALVAPERETPEQPLIFNPLDDVFTEIDLSAPKPVEEPAVVEKPAEPVLTADGFLEYTLPAAGTVIDVEQREVKLQERIDSSLYDPLKDLNDYQRPPVTLLEDYTSTTEVSDEEIYENKSRIEQTLKDFGIPIQRIKATVGPTVTLYEIVQAQGVKISRIQGLENDIAQSLKALGIRIIAPIPGKGTIGIEVPNRDKQIVSMYSSVRSVRFQESRAELPVVIGRTIQNENYIFDLAKMPHLLVAGATGQGKSVGLNAIITSLLYKKHPSQLKFVMIDPKMVEFSLYARLEKHFLAKMESETEAIVTDPKKAVYTLHALCSEMDTRLELCKAAGTRNISEYNEKFTARRLNPEKGHRYLPYIVVVVDEFADLIMTAREVEAPVMRLAQKARAVGIHLIIATQRPDVKVITGGIKANFPARIAFRVMQMIDSRTIIDQPGANQLIGRGDMLLSKDGELTRIQCALVETKEVERVVEFIGAQQGYSEAYRLPDYAPDNGDITVSETSSIPTRYDALFGEVARSAVAAGQISTSSIQRNWEVGFNRAGRIMLQLERAGIVGRQEGVRPRDILYTDLHALEARLQDLGVN